MSTWPDQMFFRETITITIQEFSSSSVTSKKQRAKKIGTSQLRFSIFRLAVALAKSVLTRNPTDLDLVKEVRASFYMLDSMISSSGSDLRVCNGFRRKYRDFSKSGRTGELAQSLSFLLSQDQLDFPIIIDFDGFLESQAITPMSSDQRTPDFALLFKNGTTQPSLIESKGACPPDDSLSVKGKLKDALEQCDIADLHIATNASRRYRVENSYGSYVRLAELNDGWNSIICFCDPTNEVTQGMAFPLDAARRYYAAWLTLSGHLDLARALINNELRSEALQSWRIIDIGGQSFSIPISQNNPFNLFTPFLAFRKPATLREKSFPEWAIRTEVIEALVDENEDRLLALFSQATRSFTDQQNGVFYFPDHTLFRFRETE